MGVIVLSFSWPKSLLTFRPRGGLIPMFICVQAAAYVFKQLLYVSKQLLGHISQQIKISLHRWKAVDLGFHLALSYRDLKHPTSRQNFANTSGNILWYDLGLWHSGFIRYSLFILIKKMITNLDKTISTNICLCSHHDHCQSKHRLIMTRYRFSQCTKKSLSDQVGCKMPWDQDTQG